MVMSIAMSMELLLIHESIMLFIRERKFSIFWTAEQLSGYWVLGCRLICVMKSQATSHSCDLLITKGSWQERGCHSPSPASSLSSHPVSFPCSLLLHLWNHKPKSTLSSIVFGHSVVAQQKKPQDNIYTSKWVFPRSSSNSSVPGLILKSLIHFELFTFVQDERCRSNFIIPRWKASLGSLFSNIGLISL